MSQATPTAFNDCWNTIGITGDGSCPRLPDAVHCRNCPVFALEGRKLFDRAAPGDYLDGWRTSLASGREAGAANTVSLLVVRVRGEWFALPTTAVEKGMSLRPVHAIPHRSNAVLLGLANLDGELMLAGSLAAALAVAEQEEQPEAAVRMVVFSHKGERWALQVDEVEGLHRVAREEVREAPVTVSRSSAAYSSGTFDLDGRLVALVEADALRRALRKGLRG